jgi:raffinose/stachyose/melibiose transport system permease protein
MIFKNFRRLLLTSFALLIAIPSLIVIFGSFKSDLEIYESPVSLPDAFKLDNYRTLFETSEIFTNFRNSVFVTSMSVVITLLLASMTAFALSKMINLSAKVMFALFSLGLAIPAQVNMIPIFILFNDLKLTNSYLGLILVNIVTTLPISIFILTSFFKELPREMYEVSAIDGANIFRIYRSIALPLSRPAMGATAIFLFVINWNDLLYPLLLITQADKKTLPLAMLDFRGEYATSFSMIFTSVMIASVPMVFMYLTMQRSFVAGLTAGAVKG